MASKGGMIGVYYSVLEAIETLGVRGTHSVCVCAAGVFVLYCIVLIVLYCFVLCLYLYLCFVFVFVLRFFLSVLNFEVHVFIVHVFILLHYCRQHLYMYSVPIIVLISILHSI
jgi:hypothetical protein